MTSALWPHMTQEERANWLERQDVILEQESGVTLDQMLACLMVIRDKAGHGDMLCINLAAGYSEETIPVGSVFLNAGNTISID